jgi:diguanylate cyclase (GGDEF)-like protein
MEDRVVKTDRVLARYRRLWDDYFPTSRHSSTPVKLTVCITEANTLWDASGGIVLTGLQDENALEVAAVRGSALQSNSRVTLEPDTFISECYKHGKLALLNDLPENQEILPGIQAGSAVCLPVLSGATVRGVLLLWSEQEDHFNESDLTGLALFASYIAVLLEVDALSDKLGENMVIDPLTGLQNRKQFDMRLRDEVLRASRYSINVSLVVFDVDHLVEYNNLCGHLLGNLALSDIASIFKKGVREVDFVARIGADEYGMILPETTRIGALRFAERMRSEVAAYPFPNPQDQSTISLTVCAGISNFPSSASDSTGLIANAYEALALAKSEGPDNIKLYGEISRTPDVTGDRALAGDETGTESDTEPG